MSRRFTRLLATGLAAAALVSGCAGAERPPVDPGDPMEGQIVVDVDHPEWFARHGGGPLFICGPGDPEGFLYRGRQRRDGTRRGDQLELIEKLAGTGANSIYLMAVRSHGGDGDPSHNPFVDNDPKLGLNELVLEQWETWFREMDRHGIVIFFFIYDDSSRIWKTGDVVEEPERQFLRTLVARFKHHKNLIWVVAEEYQERYSKKRAARIAAEIRAADEHHHPIAIHKLNGLSFSEFADDPNIDQFAIQYNVDSPEQLHEGIVRAWQRHDGRYNLNLSEAKNWGGGVEARHKAWAAALAGAYVMVLGMDIESTPLSDLEDCGRLVRFMEATDFPGMVPRDDLAHGETRYVLARPGESYVGFAPSGRSGLGFREVEVGTWELRWLDLATGREVAEGVAVEAPGDVTWDRPPGVGAEVVLAARRKAPSPAATP